MYSLLVANNPELAGDRKRFLMKPPQVVREGSKRVVIINFGDICKTLNRSQDHVFAFMLAEMGTTGSIDASSRMVIKGRFPPKAIEQIIRRSGEIWGDVGEMQGRCGGDIGEII